MEPGRPNNPTSTKWVDIAPALARSKVTVEVSVDIEVVVGEDVLVLVRSSATDAFVDNEAQDTSTSTDRLPS
jgi:hypothetical protein